MAAYPSTLPKPLASGYSVKPIDQTARTEMEGGPARVRRRTKSRNDHVTLAWLFTDTQMGTFRTWFDNDATGAAGGAAWFTIGLALGGGGVATVEARFIGPFSEQHLGALRWDVNAEVEVR
mgnify:CR=1 FL=1